MPAKVVNPNGREIAALPKANKRYRVKVDGVNGLFVDVLKSGTKTYQLRYYYAGKDRWRYLGRVSFGLAK